MDELTHPSNQSPNDSQSPMLEIDNVSNDKIIPDDQNAKDISNHFEETMVESPVCPHEDNSQNIPKKNGKSNVNELANDFANRDIIIANKMPERNEELLKIVDVESRPFLQNNDAGLVDEIDALPANLRYSNFDLTYTLISVLTYLFDLVMDCAVAYYFYHLAAEHGIYHYWYFGLTVSFVLIPSLTMNGFSLR